jgi:hypothetical protein
LKNVDKLLAGLVEYEKSAANHTDLQLLHHVVEQELPICYEESCFFMLYKQTIGQIYFT